MRQLKGRQHPNGASQREYEPDIGFWGRVVITLFVLAVAAAVVAILHS
jgi:hypothetical protein